MKSFIFPCFLLLLCMGCSSDEGSDPCHAGFDEKAMFENIAENIIVPAYENLDAKVADMLSKGLQFQSLRNLENLEELKASWKDAYLVWQEASQFEFGPAEEVFLRNSVNNFPSNIEEIESIIQSGISDFEMPDTYNKGFPAIEYMLYGIADSETGVIDLYNEPGDKYANYLLALINDISQRVSKTKTKWTDSYKNDFINNTGTAAGSSLSLLVNQLNQNYELIKRDKLGIPSGILTLNIAQPDNVETPYSNISLELAIRALRASEELYLGKNGLGLDDYIQATAAKKGEDLLDDVIQDQYLVAINAVKAIEAPLTDAVSTTGQTAAVVNAYNEVASQLIHIKTDMPSVLCISITYIDNPSDSD